MLVRLRTPAALANRTASQKSPVTNQSRCEGSVEGVSGCNRFDAGHREGGKVLFTARGAQQSTVLSQLTITVGHPLERRMAAACFASSTVSVSSEASCSFGVRMSTLD